MIKGWPEKHYCEWMCEPEICRKGIHCECIKANQTIDLCTKSLEQAEESMEGLVKFFNSYYGKDLIKNEHSSGIKNLSEAILKEYIVIRRDK